MTRFLTPALTIALLVTAGTTLNAADESARQPPSPRTVAPAGVAGSNLGSAQLSAVINANGSVARGKGELPSLRTGPGVYRVGFSRNITACTYVASVGGVGNEIATGIANVTRFGATTSFLVVRTFALNGVAADRPFHIYVDC